MKRILFALMFLACSAAHAQFVPGQLLTAGQLNSTLAAKTNNAAAAITGGTITGLSAPIPLASGGTGATSALAATSQFQFSQSGSGSVTRTVAQKLADNVTPLDKGAKGDGATDDTAAFTTFESQYAGRVVDLLGLTYVVSAVPTKNAYQNGVFKAAGNSRQAALFKTFASAKGKWHAYGGQLRALHKALTNPLEQQTTIGFFGDSITWGVGLGSENATSTPRNGTLADPRDYFATGSFVNDFKRYIGAQYFDNAAPTISNWSYSTAGQSTATYARTETLYTNLPPFSAVTLTGSATNTDSADSATLLGERHNIALASGASASFTFPFTGTTFTLVYNSVPSQSANYEVFVNGVSQGVFTTDTGASAANVPRVHTFTYVRNATIQIVAEYPSGATGVSTLRLSAIQVPKTVTIINQGVIGTDSYSYNNYNFGAFGPTIMTPDLNYVFMQLGTNDRIASTGRNQPNGINNFMRNMNTLLGKITPSATVILMNAPPAALESPPTYSFNTQDVRNTINQLGSANNLDVIDNHTIFHGMDNSIYTSDGLHPNLLGHSMIARNIINALESN